MPPHCVIEFPRYGARGDVPKVWYGAGNGTVHSMPWAPSQDLSPALRPPRTDHQRRSDRGPAVEIGELQRVVRDAALQAGQSEEVLRIEGQMEAERGQPKAPLCM